MSEDILNMAKIIGEKIRLTVSVNYESEYITITGEREGLTNYLIVPFYEVSSFIQFLNKLEDNPIYCERYENKAFPPDIRAAMMYDAGGIPLILIISAGGTNQGHIRYIQGLVIEKNMLSELKQVLLNVLNNYQNPEVI